MDKEQVLKMSRQENTRGKDEWEQSVDTKAGDISAVVGLFVCLLLVFVAAPILDNHQLAQGAWMVYFAMLGSSNLYKYLKTKKKTKLLGAVLQLFCAIGYLALLGIWKLV